MSGKVIGKTRARLATMLEEAFKAQGLSANIDPGNLRPASGAWRTMAHLDVYRWEGCCAVTYPNGATLTTPLYCWDTMTDCVRHGFVIERDGCGYDVSANEARVHPLAKRMAALSPDTGSDAPGERENG